jgi:hypothetical protein
MAGKPGVMEAVQGLQTQFCLGGTDAYTAHQQALGTIYGMVQQQASLLAYADNFRLLGYLSLLSIPLVLFFHRAQRHS